MYGHVQVVFRYTKRRSVIIIPGCRYNKVVPKCLYDSPAAVWWSQWEATGGQRADLRVHIERHADYDGLAVAWGIGNTKASVEECGEACRAHQPNPKGGAAPST